MRNRILVIVFALLAGSVAAQQEATISQYMSNGLFLNPAYAGSHSYYSATMLYRNQWVNFDGAPSTLLLQVDGPIKSQKMGLGLVVQHDRIGISNQTEVGFNYSYNLNVASGKLAFGIKGGFAAYSADFNQLVVWDADDQVYVNGVDSRLIPKAGFGAFYHTEKFYAGISSPTIIAYDRHYNFNMDLNRSSFMRRHLFGTCGYIFDANDNIKINPSMLLKYVAHAPAQVDVNVMATFKEAVGVGLSYRTSDALIAMIQYQTNTKFRIGYAYDVTTTDLRRVSSGSHEIMIGYDFGEVKEKKSVRFF